MLQGVCGALRPRHAAGRSGRAAAVSFSLLAVVLLTSWQCLASDDPPPSAPADDVPVAGSEPEPAPAGRPPPVEPTAPSVEQREAAASQAFDRAAELYDKGQRAEALAEYERAYQLAPDLQVLYNIGVINFELERWAGARRAFEQYLKLGGAALPPERSAHTQAMLDQLKAKTATLTLSMNVPPDQVKIDSSPVEVLELSGVVLDPGEHVLHVSKPGFRPLERTVHVGDGERLELVLQLFPDAPPDLRSQSVPLAPVPAPVADRGVDVRWLCWGITGALAIGWGTTAALAIKARHDRNVIEHPGTPASDIDDAQRLHKTLAIVSDVLLASTLTSAGVAAYFTWWANDTPAPSPRSDPFVHGGLRRSFVVGVSGHF